MENNTNTKNIIGTVTDELYRIFDLLNRDYFEGKLEPPVLTIQKSGRGRTLGWFTLCKVWKDSSSSEDKGRYEINITPERLNRDSSDIVGTLQHEMVHYFNCVNGVKDCSNQRHNKKFKTLAEEVGLVCEQSKTYGWGYTKCSDDFLVYIKEKIHPNEKCFSYFRVGKVEPKTKVRQKKVFKYICPECKAEVKAKKDFEIICGSCQEQMIMQND